MTRKDLIWYLKLAGVGVLFLIVLVASLPSWREKALHWFHYFGVELKGELRADPSRIDAIGGTPERPIFLLVVRNNGSRAWMKGGKIRLGVFWRDDQGHRVETEFKFTNGTNRFEPAYDVHRGELWVDGFDLIVPPEAIGKLIHFQMVDEGNTWFGEELALHLRFIYEGDDRGAPRQYAAALRSI